MVRMVITMVIMTKSVLAKIIVNYFNGHDNIIIDYNGINVDVDDCNRNIYKEIIDIRI